MPYDQLVQLNDRKQERLGMFTIEKIVGIAFTTLPIYMVSANWPPMLRFVAIGLGVYLGLRLTRRREGFSFYEWLAWWVRSQIWERWFPRDLRPEDLEGTVPSNRRDLPLSRDSIARMVTRSRTRPARPRAQLDPVLGGDALDVAGTSLPDAAVPDVVPAMPHVDDKEGYDADLAHAESTD